PTGLLPMMNCVVTDDGVICGVVGSVDIHVGWDDVDASTGGPPEFGTPIVRRGEPTGSGSREGGTRPGNDGKPQQPPERGKSEPTPDGIRLGKLVDCLDAAKADYLKVTDQTRRDYDAIFTNPTAIGQSMFSLVVGGFNGLAGGLAIRAAVGSAYHI